MKYFKVFLIIVVLISVGFILIGVIVPKISYETTITTNKPVEETWDMFSDTELMAEWMQGFKSKKVLSGDATTPGSTYEVIIVQNDEEYVMTETLVEYKEDELYVFTIENDILLSKQEVHFKSDGDGTIVTEKSVTEGKSLIMKSIISLTKSIFQKNSDEKYNSFKKLVDEA